MFNSSKKIFIRENSIIARIAAKILRSEKMAIVVGSTIHLWGSGKNELIENKRWLRHELTHIMQFRHYGFIKFILFYVWETIKNGYHNNRFEIEAREKESNKESLACINIS
ncbi:MAG TPA: DUF4157 domain-containing protein [Panacibacter sp.]|nr:DUF4157 domain-containing protein [Panacibacter sp.]